MKKVSLIAGCGGVIVGFLIFWAIFAGHSVQTTTDAPNKQNELSTNSPAFFTLESANTIPNQAPFNDIQKRAQPVLQRGAKGTWDSVDVLNPSVFKKDGIFYNYYSGYDGKVWRTGLATSADGINWTKYKGNPVLDLNKNGWDSTYIAANGSAFEFNGKIYYWYQGNQDGKAAIGLAISDDGHTFTKQNAPVLEVGSEHTWDSDGVADPYVIKHGDYLYLYYLGMNEMKVQRLGVARSKDGIHWDKLSSNPILDVGAAGTFDENGLGEPSVVYYAPYFYMIYTGRNASETRDVGLAISSDGINWRKMDTAGLFPNRAPGSWDQYVICDTTLWLDSPTNKLYAWYGGGNKQEPAQNLNGNIGLFTVNIGQDRDLSSFIPAQLANNKAIKSTDILKGSYPIEGDNTNKFVWVGKESEITLLNKKSPLQIKGYIPVSSHQKANPNEKEVTIKVFVDGKEVKSTAYTADSGIDITLDPASYSDWPTDDFIHLKLVSSSDFTPAKIGSGEDQRALAFILNSIQYTN
ncbi:hypothetical protein [Paenibacillus campi]|uniref:hypothetical protein n=1 Tax=Paenibacillus campi TaxID=3106031 RepID=UPI002AFFC84B|nr:hypothetical protein [Paenibacillus sp. SGZ-1014]